MQAYRGQCHCGTAKVAMHSAKAVVARSCACTYCQMTGAMWISDADGRMEIMAESPFARYRFGTQTADFLICGRCGVLFAAVSEIDGLLVGVANIRCFAAKDEFAIDKQLADFESELVATRLDRRAGRWTPTWIENEAAHA